MRRTLALLGFLLGTAGPAAAADYQPVVPDLYNWTGFYLGVTGGWAFDGELQSEPKDLPFIKFDQQHQGGLAGGFAAARYQFEGSSFVLGAEVTGLKSWIEGEDNFSDILIFPFELTSHATVDTLILAEGQAGITFGADNRALAYVDAGFAMADISLDSHLKIPGLFSEKIFDASNTANGVVVGGGIDYALAGYPNVVLGLSFKHIVLNELDLSDTLKGGMSYGAEPVCECRGDAWKIDTNSNFNIDQVMGRIAVHF